MRSEELTKEESLAIITEMIGQAKRNFARGGSFYFLLWGWVVMICNLGHYLLWKTDLTDAPFIIWLLTIPAAMVSIIYGTKKSSSAKVKSHIDDLYGLIWLGIITGALVTLYFVADMSNTNGIILIFSALGTYLSGCTLRFFPSIVGSVLLLAAAILTFYVPLMEQYLVAAVGILAGYIVPGYLMKKAEGERI